MELGKLGHHIAFQVHLTWRALRRRLLANVRESGDSVSRGTYSIPILIELNPGISPLELANTLNLDASKIAFFIKEFESEGLVIRRRSTADKRMIELFLTDKGEEFVKDAWRKSYELEAPFHAALGEEDRRNLIELLTKLRNGLS